MQEFFKSQLDYCFFLYGLAFILLAAVCQHLSRKPKPRLAWGWLGLFGMLHGINEWLDMLALVVGNDPHLALIRFFPLFFSFLFLLEFARVNTLRLYGVGPGRWLWLPLSGLIMLGGLAGLPGLSAAARYVLATGGGLWAGLVLYLVAIPGAPGNLALRVAGVGMGVYGLAAGLMVNPAPFFPASVLNVDSVLALTGFPIQMVRMLLALMISVALWLYAQVSLSDEVDRHSQLLRKNLIVGSALGLVLLLSVGWVITQTMGNNATRELESEYEYHAKILGQVLVDKMKEADHLAQVMAGSPEIREALTHTGRNNLQGANAVLDRFSQAVPLSVCYLMDLKGLTIAASNRDRPDSFVGKNYGFRPYFQMAEAGSPGRYFALGVTSGERGYYSSYPVWETAGGVVGVAVIKRPLDVLEALFHKNCFTYVIDPHGIVFLTNQPHHQLRSLWPLTPEARQELLASRQFGIGPFIPILAQEPQNEAHILFQGQRHLVLRQPLAVKGWSVVHLGTAYPIALARLLGIGVTMLLGFGLIWLATLWDTTIDASARLRKTERKYHELYEAMRDGSAAVNLGGKFIEGNQAFLQMLGYTLEELQELTDRDVTPEKWHSFEEDILKDQVSTRGYSEIYQKEYRRKDGVIFPVELRTYLIKGEDGEPVGMWAIVRDITERVQSEQALRESEEKYRVTMDNAPEGILLADFQGNFVDANQKMVELLGYSKTELLQMNVAQIHPPEELERTLKAFRDMTVRGIVTFTNGWVVRKDGRRTPVDITGAVITYGGQSVVQGIFRDISERQRTEEERTRISKLESLGVLAGGIAHDFNNILTAILGNISLAVLASQVAGQSLDRLAEAEKACLRAQALARQLLTFAKGGTPIKKQTSIADLLKEAAGFTLSGSKARCQFTFAPDLWWVEVDEGQISQVINNLLINADQSMPEGGVIEITAENVCLTGEAGLSLQPGPYVKITVADQGIGIPAKYLSKVFDPYFTTKRQGSGLGLATAYSIIKNHGGYISVNSAVGEGTTFVIFLPAIEVAAARSEAVPPKPLAGQGRILVMDDDEMVRMVLGRMLESLNYQVDFAPDGAEAVRLYDQARSNDSPFTAVILDLTVPGGMGGKEAINHLQKIDPQVKALVSSGYSDDPIMADYQSYGFSGVIVKPYRIMELSKILQEVIHREPAGDQSTETSSQWPVTSEQ